MEVREPSREDPFASFLPPVDADGLAGKDLTEIDLLPIEADAAASQKQSADENRRRPPGDSFLLRRSRFSTLAFGAAFWTSSVDVIARLSRSCASVQARPLLPGACSAS